MDSIEKLKETLATCHSWKAELPWPLTKMFENQPTVIDLFHLTEQKRSKVQYYHSRDYRPSQNGWDELKNDLIKKGYEHGHELIAKGFNINTQRVKSYVLICKRGRVSGGKQSTTDSDNFASHAKSKQMKRSKFLEKKAKRKCEKDCTQRHASSKKPTKKEDLCKVFLRLYEDNGLDLFYSMPGIGSNSHVGHPKITQLECVPLKSTLTCEERKAKKQKIQFAGDRDLHLEPDGSVMPHQVTENEKENGESKIKDPPPQQVTGDSDGTSDNKSIENVQNEESFVDGEGEVDAKKKEEIVKNEIFITDELDNDDSSPVVATNQSDSFEEDKIV